MSLVEQIKSRVETIKGTATSLPAVQKVKSTLGLGGFGLLKGETLGQMAVIEKVKSIPVVQKVQSIPVVQKVQSLPFVSNVKNAFSTAKSVGIGKGGIVQGLTSFPVIQSVQSKLKGGLASQIAPEVVSNVAPQTIKPDISVELQEKAYVAARRSPDISIEL